MNQSKIAAIYEAIDYPTLLLLLARKEFQEVAPYNVLDWRVGRLLADANSARMTSTQGHTYGVSLKNIDDDTVRFDARGEKMYDDLRVTLSARAYRWASAQIQEPEDFKVLTQAVRATGQQVHSLHLMKYSPKDGSAKTEGKLAFGSEADLAGLVRGFRSFQRKQDKAVKKAIAQLVAYHEAQLALADANDKARLRRGEWLGADKALTTAPRVNEPGVPYMGEMTERPAGLAYWTVRDNGGMDTHFPAGTGLALKQLSRSRELVDGAVYVWSWQWGATEAESTTLIGRCDLSAKTRGLLPIRHEDGALMPMCWLSWESPEIKVYRVTHYTTRAEQLAPMAAEAQLARPALRSGKKRALQAAA